MFVFSTLLRSTNQANVLAAAAGIGDSPEAAGAEASGLLETTAVSSVMSAYTRSEYHAQ